jgi:hypothetical protein
MNLDFLRKDSQCSREFLIGFSPGLWVPGIDQYSFLSALDPIQKIDRSNSRRLHLLTSAVGSLRYAEFHKAQR